MDPGVLSFPLFARTEPRSTCPASSEHLGDQPNRKALDCCFFVFSERSGLSSLACALTDKHLVWPVFSRNSRHSSPVCVGLKWFMENLNPLNATLTKNTQGEGGAWRVSAPCLSSSVAIPLVLLQHLQKHGVRGALADRPPLRVSVPPWRSAGPIAAERLWCNNLRRHGFS